MAIYLSRKKGSGSATPITPSNSSPAQMTANTPVNPTGNGYAIESYSSITPSNSSPATITSGSIYKASANGKAVESVTNLFPTNANPVTITSGEIYKATGDGKAIHHLAPLTPSNINPDTITQGDIYMGVDNGYAIQSYDSVTPSSTPASVASGDIVKIGGNGVIVDSILTPTSLTPDNSNPATITSGETYTATANGKAVSSVTDITPSNSSPVSLSSGTIYKPSASGYAISSYSSKTPSDSSPASVSSGAIIKNAGNSTGYLYASSGLKKVKTGTFTTSTTGTITVNCGFQPKYLAVEMDGNTSSAKHAMYIYNYDTDSSSYYRANQANYPTTYTLPQTADNLIGSITSSGFTMTKTSPARTGRYFAIG